MRPGLRDALIRYAPLVLWMAAIFVFSTEVFTVQRTYGVVRTILRFFFPSLSPSLVGLIHMGVRKAAHAVNFAILAVLLVRALAGDKGMTPGVLAKALVAAVGYAALDEIHQAFAPGRDARLRDVGIDALGALAGLAFCSVAGRWRARSRP